MGFNSIHLCLGFLLSSGIQLLKSIRYIQLIAHLSLMGSTDYDNYFCPFNLHN